ncbi:tyrosine-type recombinase/integrase [Ectothiorhodospira variabilis]|uniref:tyrosine-type recombinase/integrase n=1 Tax=Ectothiorhodospira variabilis TaxID=505694 RepID=UPI001EFB92BB|nr:site-specific integrase [Ectothiorhodospira variabilis]MCG5498640.1 site-specific integrase [Ectothiorhodospira variabilis]
MTICYQVTRFVMDSGERYCLLKEQATCLPLYYPNLYLLTQLRNRSVAFATIEAEAAHLAVFHRYLIRRGINLDERISTGMLLRDFELEDLYHFTQRKALKVSTDVLDNSLFMLEELEESTDPVGSSTHYARLTATANYIQWLARHLLENPPKDYAEQISSICNQIKERRPSRKNRNRNGLGKSLTDEQIDLLFEVMRPGAELNPFTVSVQKRNRLIVLLLFHLGIRGGELLNLRIRDIDFSANQLKVVRRADETGDARTREPNTKTLGRVLPLGDVLAKELHDYIVNERRKVPHAKSNDYLIITHKEGPTQGAPISKAAYYKVIAVVRSVSPQLYEMSGHMFRHTWNRKFSEKMDEMDSPMSPERQEQVRSFLMGWKEGSNTASLYNRRFAEQKAHEAALDMQKTSGVRVPRGLADEK